MNSESVIIFTDGSSRGNPGPGGWGTVVVSPKGVTELGGREEHTTNNRMELTAAIAGLKSVIDTKSSIEVYSDSSYVINGITKWVSGWKRSGWLTKEKKEVLNRDLWEELARVVEGKKITWKYVGGHVGIVGNERCDEIATKFADNEKVDLFKGSIDHYSIGNILDTSFDESKAKEKSRSKSRSSRPAFSYLSLVDGKIEKHKTWKECEERVRGISGAKFKKSLDAAEEKSIIDGWK